jgi:peptide/bleomycin uptake transporter
METLGTSFFEAILVLFEFFPILMTISIGLPILWFGEWEYGLVVGAFMWSVGGTLFMILLAWILRLVGIEYDLQKKEAAYRKILVIAEDDGSVRPKSLNELFEGVRSIHYKSYLNYFYFNIGRLAYLQANVLSAYILIAPAIVAGVMTLGVMQQLVRAFGRVEASMQYLFNSWPTLIELASVYKRLREFEQKLENLEEEIRV